MAQKFYVASCVFERFNLPIIRCCVDKYKVAEFEQRMPADYRETW